MVAVQEKVEVEGEQEEKKEEKRIFGGGICRMPWPPSEPEFGDCDRREGIQEARQHPDFYKSFMQYMDELNLDCEKHEHLNRSGYHQMMFRVRDKTVGNQNQKGVVFLQHGLFASADSWVVHKENSLAVKLARQGFDVWLGNSRGNIYSRKHEMHDEYWNKYWEFTIDDLAMDLIENIDIVRLVSGMDKVSFVGHGHGAT